MLLKPLPNFPRTSNIDGSAIGNIVVSRKHVPVLWLVADKSLPQPACTGLVVHGEPVNGSRVDPFAEEWSYPSADSTTSKSRSNFLEREI